MPMPTTPQTAELGYVLGGSSWWDYTTYETTPELIWPLNLAVYDRMRRQDAQIASVLRAVALPLRRTQWRIHPAGARDEVVQFVADDLGLPIVGREGDQPFAPRTQDRFSWPDHLRLALQMLPMGFAAFEQVYRVDEAGRARLRKLAPRPQRTVEGFDTAADGGLVALRQFAVTGGGSIQIPVDRLVLYVHEMEPGDWRGTSLLRPAYKHWLLKDPALRVWAQTLERNGMGVPVYTGPENPADPVADRDAGLTLAKNLRAGAEAGGALPYGAKLELTGVQGRIHNVEPFVRYHDEQIAHAVLAHFLNLGQQTGTSSYALGETLSDFFTMSLQTIGLQIADVATSHIVEDIVDVNFGPAEPAPRLTFDEIGSRHQLTAQALQMLVSAGVVLPDRELEQSVRTTYGLPPKRVPSPSVPGQAAGTQNLTVADQQGANTA